MESIRRKKPAAPPLLGRRVAGNPFPGLAARLYRGAVRAALLAMVLSFCSCAYTFTRVEGAPIDSVSRDDILDAARDAFDRRDYDRAVHLANFVGENFPDSPEVEEALYIVGEGSFLDKEYWEAFQAFKEILMRFRTSQYIDHIAMRYYEIGEAYLNREPGFFGHLFTARSRGVKVMNDLVIRFRQIDVADDARMAVADYYFGEKKYQDAALYYERLIKEYPRSEWVEKAVYRYGVCNLSSSKGPSYDREILLKAHEAFTAYGMRYPHGHFIGDVKERENTVLDLLARKEMEIAKFYLNQNRDYGARIHLANIVLLFPETAPALEAETLLMSNHWDASIHSMNTLKPHGSTSFLR